MNRALPPFQTVQNGDYNHATVFLMTPPLISNRVKQWNFTVAKVHNSLSQDSGRTIESLWKIPLDFDAEKSTTSWTILHCLQPNPFVLEPTGVSAWAEVVLEWMKRMPKAPQITLHSRSLFIFKYIKFIQYIFTCKAIRYRSSRLVRYKFEPIVWH